MVVPLGIVQLAVNIKKKKPKIHKYGVQRLNDDIFFFQIVGPLLILTSSCSCLSMIGPTGYSRSVSLMHCSKYTSLLVSSMVIIWSLSPIT